MIQQGNLGALSVAATYLDETGIGDERIMACSNTSIDELGGFCPWGISAVKVTLWAPSLRFWMFASMLFCDVEAGDEIACPSTETAYDARVTFPLSSMPVPASILNELITYEWKRKERTMELQGKRSTIERSDVKTGAVSNLSLSMDKA